MTTLCDRLMTFGTISEGGHRLDVDLRGPTGDLIDNLDLHPIKIDNIAQYYFDKHITSPESVPLSEVGNVAPPFLAFFMEWNLRATPPLQQAIGVTGEAHVGVSWACSDLKKLYQVELEYNPADSEARKLIDDVQRAYPTLVKRYKDKMDKELLAATYPDLDTDNDNADPAYIAWLRLTNFYAIQPFITSADEHAKFMDAQLVAAALYPMTDIRWIYQSMGYIEYPKGQIRGPLFAAMTPVKNNGVILGQGIMHRCYPDLITPPMQAPLVLKSDLDQSRWFSHYMMMPCLYAINFLHMKNVLLLPNRPEPKLAKAFRKRHRKDLIQYFTMHVVTPKQAVRYEKTKQIPDEIKNTVSQPFHIRQGAWRHYADEDGHRLFGLYAGDFFVPSYAAGNKEVGTNIATREVEKKHERRVS